MREWYQQCNHCDLLKAKHSQTHSKYTYCGMSGLAPHKQWATDFHGVGPKGKTANALRAISLNIFHVRLRVMKRRSAENVKCFVCNRILFWAGTPPITHLGNSYELVCCVMIELSNNSGYVNTLAVWAGQ